jgi:type IV secretion system protein TrbC
MENSHLKNSRRKGMTLLAMIFAGVNPAFASSSGSLPFNSTMNTLKDAISGPFLLAAAIIMIVITCLMLAFGEWGDGFKKIINMVMWLSIAFAATSFVTSMFGSGAVF